MKRLVDTYAAGATEHQRRMFDDSLRAALTLEEVRIHAGSLDAPDSQVFSAAKELARY